MACFRPNMVIYVSGSSGMKFAGRYSDSRAEAFRSNGWSVTPVPCNHCNGCRLDYSKKWADRMLLEFATVRDDMPTKTAIFMTLTYDDEHLRFATSRDGVPVPTLSRYDVQSFMWKFRQYWRKYGKRLRVYYAGEYGDHTFRPHYHMILYGLSIDDFPDKFVYSTNQERGTILYESDLVNHYWEKGAVRFSSANYQTMCYVARYVVKKQFGIDKLKYDGRCPPFNGSSNKPGLGSDYFDLLDLDVDRVSIFDGKDVHDVGVPRIVLEHIKQRDEDLYNSLMEFRRSVNQGKSDLLMSQTDKSYMQYLHDKEVDFNLKHGILYTRKDI